MATSVVKIIIKIFFALLFIVVLTIGIKGCRKLQKTNMILQGGRDLLSFKNDSLGKQVKKWRDSDSVQHATTEALRISNEELNLYTDELEDKLKIKGKQIKTVTKYVTKTEVVKELVPIYKIRYDTNGKGEIDSSYGVEYVDNYIDLKIKKNSFNLQMWDTISQTSYWKRSWFLARKKHFVDISTVSPYTNIEGIKALELAPKRRPKVTFGPSFGYTYDGTQWKPSIGISGVIPIISIR